VIAIFYSDSFHPVPFLAAAACVAVWAVLQHRRVTGGAAIALIYVPLALLTWYLVHDSGVHATVAGIGLGLTTRVSRDPWEKNSPGERAEIGLRPFVSGFAVPVFAFTAAGVTIRNLGLPGQAEVPPLTETLTSPVALGVIFGLLVGKPVGVVGGAWLMARFTRAQLNPALRWSDIGAVGLLAGIGFTVSLLIAELAFEDDPQLLAEGKVGILAATVAAALAASVALVGLRRRLAHLIESEEADSDHDGIPDVYQEPTSEPPDGRAR
jgi:Na+:H+ antiporter, NhaA family